MFSGDRTLLKQYAKTVDTVLQERLASSGPKSAYETFVNCTYVSLIQAIALEVPWLVADAVRAIDEFPDDFARQFALRHLEWMSSLKDDYAQWPTTATFATVLLASLELGTFSRRTEGVAPP